AALAAGLGAGAAVGALAVLFPGDGPFPFAWTGLVVVGALCALLLTPLVAVPGWLRVGAALYGLATLASFVVANPLGGNATRLAESAGIPLALAAVTRSGVRRWRRVVGVAALAPFVVWQWAPATSVRSSLAAPRADTAAYYRPLAAEIRRLGHGVPVRVEVVPTRHHWESAYVVGPDVTLARGWERQLDVRDDPLFYRSAHFGDRAYRAWLERAGVAFVALPHAALDYAGRAEAALLRRGVPGLAPAWSTSGWALWRVVGSPGLVSGPGRLVSLRPDGTVLRVERPGRLLLRVRYTGYWTRRGAPACVAPAAGGWTAVRAAKAGTLVLDARLAGGTPATCRSSGGA
ncbi:MAG TPA: hypothetical protein VKV25_01695, partial [Acidimicrobiales bacterium]|nr:hypothetical protein [Acidimicrobiales bacterium]